MDSPEHEQIERQKLLTRCRRILLDNGIFNPEQAAEYGDLTRLRGLGPKASVLIWDAINTQNAADLAYLFPYPDGIDEAYYLPAGTVWGEPDDSAAEAEPAPDAAADAQIPAEFVAYALASQNRPAAWVAGYLSALADTALGVPGAVEAAARCWSQALGDLLAEPATSPTATTADGLFRPGDFPPDDFRAFDPEVYQKGEC